MMCRARLQGNVDLHSLAMAKSLAYPVDYTSLSLQHLDVLSARNIQRVEHRASHPLKMMIRSHALSRGRFDGLSLRSNCEWECPSSGESAFHGFVFCEVEAVADDESGYIRVSVVFLKGV